MNDNLRQAAAGCREGFSKGLAQAGVSVPMLLAKIVGAFLSYVLAGGACAYLSGGDVVVGALVGAGFALFVFAWVIVASIVTAVRSYRATRKRIASMMRGEP